MRHLNLHRIEENVIKIKIWNTENLRWRARSEEKITELSWLPINLPWVEVSISFEPLPENLCKNFWCDVPEIKWEVDKYCVTGERILGKLLHIYEQKNRQNNRNDCINTIDSAFRPFSLLKQKRKNLDAIERKTNLKIFRNLGFIYPLIVH